MSQLQVTGEAKVRDIQGPVVANSGVITALDGDASQYVRGDGTLADFPTSTGGGSSVSYYLNSSVSQGTIGGVAYRQLGKTPIIGAGTDITISANGYVASYLTDANDPALLEVPAGNFNCEFYFSVNSNAHNPFFYAEVYKYDGSTFSLIGTSVGVPEYLSNGTTLSPYYFAIPVSQTVLTITDRIAIRIYVNVDGRVVTLHTENGHLCQVVTTFSKGLTSLNNLTRQVQFLATGTSGTDFGISSSVATHTFNLPIASATNTGKLSSTDWSTFNGKVPYTGATANVDLGAFSLTASSVAGNSIFALGGGTVGGYISLKQGDATIINVAGYNNIYANDTKYVLIANAGTTNYKLASFELSGLTNNTARTFTLPDLSGTLALLEGTQTFTGDKEFTGFTSFTNANGTYTQYGITLTKGSAQTGFFTSNVSIYADAGVTNLVIANHPTYKSKLQFQDVATLTSNYTYTFPAATGTIALTSDLSGYVTLATAQVITGSKIFGSSVSIITGGQASLSVLSSTGNSALILGYVNNVLKGTIDISATEFKLISAIDNILKFQSSTNFRASLIFSSTADYSYTYPNASGTIALLESNQTFSGTNTFSSNIIVSGITIGKGRQAGTGTSNIGIGFAALAANTTGINNLAIGSGTLYNNTTGDNNISLGYNTLEYNTTGGSNIALGLNTLGDNTTGNNNIGIGIQALEKSTTADGNIGIGYGSLALNTTGVYNTAIGYIAGSAITTGSYNTIVGRYNGTTTMSNNIVLADGQGNIRYQWNGTNNVFGNPISGTSALFSSSVTATSGNFTVDDAATNSVLDILTLTHTTSGTAASGLGAGILFRAERPSSGIVLNRGAIYGVSGTDPDDNGDLAFYTLTNTGASGFSEKMRIKGNGNVGIGTNSPSNFSGVGFGNPIFDVAGVIQIKGTAGNTIAPIQFGGDTYRKALIYSSVGTDDPYLAFGTASSGSSSSAAERMRISSGGDIGMGAASITNIRLFIKGATADSSTQSLNVSNSTGTNLFYARNDGYLYSIGAWSGSDRRLKENITDLDNGLEKVLNLKARKFDLIDGLKNNYGFIAQELQEVIPDAVSVFDEKDEMLAIRMDYIIPHLVKAIQEQQQQIQELKAEIDELKNK